MREGGGRAAEDEELFPECAIQYSEPHQQNPEQTGFRGRQLLPDVLSPAE